MNKPPPNLGVQALYEVALGPDHTGWPPGLLQDDSKELSRWLATRPNARRVLREALEILEKSNDHTT